MFDGLIARLPIYDRTLGIYGYELKLCSGNAWRAGVGDDPACLAASLVDASRDLELESIVGDNVSLIRLPAELVSCCEQVEWPRNRLVFALPESAIADTESARVIGELASQGVRIAVDNLTQSLSVLQKDAGYISLCSMEAGATGGLSLLTAVASPERRPHFLVRALETADQYDYFQRLGFDYYEGSFFVHPRLIHGTEIPADRLSALKLLSYLQDPEVGIRQVEEMVSNDVTLSYKLLRLINSAYFGMPRQVESIKRAVVFFGLQRIKNWVSVALVNAIEFRPRELLNMALIRAKTCETIAQNLGRESTEAYHIAGLFSLLDAIMDAPMAYILEKLRLHDDINQALLRGAGPIGEVLQSTLALERGAFDELSRNGLTSQASPLKSYLDAISYASEIGKQLR